MESKWIDLRQIRYSLARLQRSWARLIDRYFDRNSRLADLLNVSGPLAIGCGLLLMLCIIFTIIYRSGKGKVAGKLSLLSGAGSGLLALLWAREWSDYDGLEIVPVALVFIVLLIILIIDFRTCKVKHTEKRKAREERRAAMAEQTEAEREARKARHAEQMEAVKETANKLSGKAKEGINLLTAATKKIIADGNQTVEYVITTETATTALELSDVYVANLGRDPHAAQKVRGLHVLLQEGVITEEEYTEKAAQLLKRL